MRYLKKNNEVKFWRTVNLEPLKELCENSLAYLLDEDFELKLETRIGRFPGVNISLESKITHTWSEIKDYYIPFLQLLTRRYKLYPYYQGQRFDTDGNLVNKCPVFIAMGGDDYDYYPLEDLIEDKIYDNHNFYSIEVKVGEKL